MGKERSGHGRDHRRTQLDRRAPISCRTTLLDQLLNMPFPDYSDLGRDEDLELMAGYVDWAKSRGFMTGQHVELALRLATYYNNRLTQLRSATVYDSPHIRGKAPGERDRREHEKRKYFPQLLEAWKGVMRYADIASRYQHLTCGNSQRQCAAKLPCVANYHLDRMPVWVRAAEDLYPRDQKSIIALRLYIDAMKITRRMENLPESQAALVEQLYLDKDSPDAKLREAYVLAFDACKAKPENPFFRVVQAEVSERLYHRALQDCPYDLFTLKKRLALAWEDFHLLRGYKLDEHLHGRTALLHNFLAYHEYELAKAQFRKAAEPLATFGTTVGIKDYQYFTGCLFGLLNRYIDGHRILQHPLRTTHKRAVCPEHLLKDVLFPKIADLLACLKSTEAENAGEQSAIDAAYTELINALSVLRCTRSDTPYTRVLFDTHHRQSTQLHFATYCLIQQAQSQLPNEASSNPRVLSEMRTLSASLTAQERKNILNWRCLRLQEEAQRDILQICNTEETDQAIPDDRRPKPSSLPWRDEVYSHPAHVSAHGVVRYG